MVNRLYLLGAGVIPVFSLDRIYGNMGWVNPLRSNPDEGEDVQIAMQHYMDLMQDFIPANTLRRNRQRFLIGTTDCNSTIGISDYREHASVLADHGYTLTKSFLSIGVKNGLDQTYGYASGEPIQYDALQGKTQDLTKDQTQPQDQFLMSQKATGIYLESNEENCEAVKKNLGHTFLRVVCQEVTPINVIKLLEVNVPSTAKGVRHFDLIKMDNGLYDAGILKTLLLNGFTAKHFLLGINAAIPPPYKFAAHYHPRLAEVARNMTESGKEWALQGMSLQMAISIMKEYHYDFVTFNYNYALFVGRNYKSIYGFQSPFDEFDCYHKSAIANSGITFKQTRKWFYEAPVEQANAEIFQYMIKHSLPASNGRTAFPFELTY